VDAPVPLIVLAALAALALVAAGPRARAWSLLGALALAPVVLLAHVDVPGDAGVLAAGGAAGLVVVAALAVLFARRPVVVPVAAAVALPFRVPLALEGQTASLLVPLYAVIAAAVLAHAAAALRVDPEAPPAAERERSPGWLERALAVVLVLHAVRSVGSSDADKALKDLVFFHVPFALLFVVLRRTPWSPRAVLAAVAALALAFAAVGFVEYATRTVLLNPRVIASNQVEDYFRVNSLFFDPNIYGRFLAVVLTLLVAWLLWARRARDAALAAALVLVLWAGLVLTLSQSSLTALLVGLAVLGGLRWGRRRAWVAATAAVLLAAPAGYAVAAGRDVDRVTSGRADLVAGGARLFAAAPLLGHGSGSFAREYRRAEDASAQRATSASHTTPLTVAAEQGLVGLAAYVALLAAAFARLLRGPLRSAPARAAVLAAFAGLVVHTMLYAAFLEDPVTWVLLAAGTALARPAGASS
jgi:O-antigen ligase